MQNSLILGNPDAQVTITAFLSLHCGPCKNAFIQLKKLLDNCQDVNVNVIFSVHDDEQSKKLINSIYYIYQATGQSDTTDFLFNWYNTPRAERKELYDKDLPKGFDKLIQIKEENQEMYEENKVSGTPTIFVNGYKFPKQYDISDIDYYLDEINNLIRESVFATSRKRQEAQANQEPLPASHFPQQRKEVM
jgi:protein-disulfide isomerase